MAHCAARAMAKQTGIGLHQVVGIAQHVQGDVILEGEMLRIRMPSNSANIFFYRTLGLKPSPTAKENGYGSNRDGDGANSPQNLHKKGIQNQLSKIMVVLLHSPG